MAIYVPKCQGYIIDPPIIDFIRCDGTVFNYDEVNSASLSNTNNTQTITGGQGSYPLAFIDTDKTLELSFTSSQFSTEMFEMANATSVVEGDVGVPDTGRFTVEAGLTITIPYEVQTGSVKIRGLTETTETTPATGQFKVAIVQYAAAVGEGNPTPATTTVTFASGDVTVGDTIRASFRRRVVSATTMSVRTTSTLAKGEVITHWPIYSSGTDCTEASRKGILHWRIYRVRCTAAPGFDTSYKTAATNTVTFSAIDPKRTDGKIFEMIYEPLSSSGEIVTVSTETVTWGA